MTRLDESAIGYPWGAQLPTLSGTRVALRGLVEADVPALFEVFSDGEVMRYWSTLPMTDLVDAVALLREIEEAFRTRTLFQWGIVRTGEAGVIGTCTIFRLDLTHRRAEIGFALGRKYWGQGFASEALSAAISFAFGPLGLHRLEADVDPRNERSLRALERQGFEREGHLRERYHVGGETQDSVILGLLRPNWMLRAKHAE